MEYFKNMEVGFQQQVLGNPYVMALMKVTLALYGAQIAPSAPQFLQDFFKNTFAKIFLIALIIYLSERDLQLALIISILYVLGMNYLSGRGYLESFADYSSEYKVEGSGQLIEPKTALYPGCENVTMEDLVNMFDGDHMKFKNAVQYSFQELMLRSKTKDSKEMLMKLAMAAGLPYNLSFDKPETAPYIATLLVNYGFSIKDKCEPPQ
jgi:hypothetical protein